MKLLRLLPVVVLLAACGSPLSGEWGAADTFLVVRKDDQRLLVGIDTKNSRALSLAFLPGSSSTVPDTALLTVDDRVLALVGDGFAADAVYVECGLRQASRLDAGLYPTVSGATMLTVGADRAVVTYHGLREIGRETWAEQVVAGDGRCLVGTGGSGGVLRRGSGAPVGLGADTVPLAVSCADGAALVSVSGAGPNAPSHVVLVRGSQPEPVRTGPNPRAVRLLGNGQAAVDVERGGGRAIQIVDVPGGQVRHEVAVPETSQVTSIDVARSGLVVATGGRFTTVIDPMSGTANTIGLPGESVVYLSRQ